MPPTQAASWHGLPAGDTVCSVRPIVQSSLVLIESEWLSEGSSEATRRPSFVFLIYHPVTQEYIVWDLGIRRNLKQHFPDPSLDKFEAHFEEEVTDSLRRINVSPEQVSKVFISHKHWDHTGDPSLFPKATFYIGADDLEGLTALKQESDDGRVVPVRFGADGQKHPIAAFRDSIDLYGDGSIVIVDAQGHTPGHINLLVRTATNEYALLASDGCHHTLLLSPEPEHAHRTFGKFRAYGEDESVEPSHQFYEDVEAAQKYLEGLRACQARDDVLVVIAHNEDQWKRWFGGEQYGVGPDLAGWKSKGLDE